LQLVEVIVTSQTHPLELYFSSLVQSVFEMKAGLRDPMIANYVARMLCEFSDPGNVYRLYDETGRRLEDLKEMAHAADPVRGTATSFDEERAIRRSMGDYALFVAGMCHEAIRSGSNERVEGPTLSELIAVGKESYHIVSQFNLFEYQADAPFFAQLANEFERCVLGLVLVHEHMADAKVPLPSAC
jgi:hypothetical protein